MADGNALEQPLGVAPGLLGIGQAVEQRGEFVPAHACQQGFTAQTILELLGHPAQNPVTSIVAEGIVDTLEAIQVHVHQGLRTVRTLIAQQRPFGRLVEPTAIEQAGEGVGNGLVFELLVQVVHRRHVQHGHHHRLLLGRQGRTGQGHRQQLAARATQLGVVHAVDAPGQVALVERRILPRTRRAQLQQPQQIDVLQLFDRRCQQGTDSRVGEANDAACIHHQNTLGRIVQNGCIESAGFVEFTGQRLQTPPIALLVEQGLNLGLENLRVERLEHVVHSAVGIAFQYGGLGLLVGCQENDGRKPGSLAATHQTSDFEAVHLGHMHIE